MDDSIQETLSFGTYDAATIGNSFTALTVNLLNDASPNY